MPSFPDLIRPYVRAELRAAEDAERRGDATLSFSHLERAHVLGQASTVEHVRVHCRMLVWGIRHRVFHEVFGQLLRIVGAATKTAFGLVPSGNTGGADISPFKPLPIAPDLARVLESVRKAAVT